MNIEEKVREILVNELGLEPAQVTRDARFVEDLGADSLDQLEVLVAIEEEFACEIEDEDAERWSTVGDVIAYLEGRAPSQPGGAAG